MIDSLYCVSVKILERCENCFVDYKMNYKKFSYLMRQTTKDMNEPIFVF